MSNPSDIELEIPNMLSDWILETYGEDILNEYIKNRIETVFSETSNDWVLGPDPRKWIVDAFDWSISEEKTWTRLSFHEWCEVSVKWIRYLDAL